MKRVAIYFSVLFFMSILVSCKRFLEIKPPVNELSAASTFADDAGALSAIRGIYSAMLDLNGFSSGGLSSVTYVAAFSSDEFKYHAIQGEISEFAANSINPSNSIVNSCWVSAYKYIFYANSVLEGLEKSSGVSTRVKNQLMGEAKFIRAFCNFYLTSMFGAVPLVVSTDYRVNTELEPSGEEDVYELIFQDLNEAEQLLVNDYSFSNQERTRVNRWAAIALLARAHLYSGNWEEADRYATLVIENKELFNIEFDLDKVFLKNSKEAIWQLMPTSTVNNTIEAGVFSPNTLQLVLSLDDQFIDAFSEEDKRKEKWTDTVTFNNSIRYYPYKYKVVGFTSPYQEYSMVFRLAEQYLIRAEARANLNKVNGIEGAMNDVNLLRLRAGLEELEVFDKQEALLIIENERRLELFSEWGHRWFDLKRTGLADEKLSAIKPDWKPTSILYPIPEQQLNKNIHLSQNIGY